MSPTLDLSQPALRLSFSPTRLSIVQYSSSQRTPKALIDLLTADESVPFLSITRTPAETSIIVPSKVFDDLSDAASPSAPFENPIEASGPWLALVVAGPMDLSLTGILHALTGPLKEAGVPVFASSTWDTDYVLINADKKDVAKDGLEAAGWTFD
ncbi:hypothetical protein JCM3766R1_003631 [Sporobolomyces carnicolor]